MMASVLPGMRTEVKAQPDILATHQTILSFPVV